VELLAMGATELGAEGGHHPQMLAAKTAFVFCHIHGY